MTLSRALTKRIGNRDRDNNSSNKDNKDSGSSGFSLNLSSKRNSMGIKKGLISSPVELISTTNSLVHTAPSVQNAQNNVRLSTSIEIPPSPTSSSTPPPLTPDHGSTDQELPSPPTTPTSEKLSGRHSRSGSVSSGEKPLPPRSNSVLSHRRTVSSTPSHRSSHSISMPFTPAVEKPIVPARINRATSNASKTKPTGTHPFGKELAQVSELAEEMGLDLDEECMVQRGLYKFAVEEYLAEVEDVVIVKGLFGRQPSVRIGGLGWI